ncbi:MAG TPA: hypothetical protein PK095_25125, partial [Myxococcota bacterium]|nr:hypothetical protein [Myxococcota bacterium]
MTAPPISSPRPKARRLPGHPGLPALALLLGLFVVLGQPAHAEPASYEAELCAPPDDSLSPTRWLRATSLAVRGLVPTLEEYQAVASADAETLEATVDQLVD